MHLTISPSARIAYQFSISTGLIIAYYFCAVDPSPGHVSAKSYRIHAILVCE